MNNSNNGDFKHTGNSGEHLAPDLLNLLVDIDEHMLKQFKALNMFLLLAALCLVLLTGQCSYEFALLAGK